MIYRRSAPLDVPKVFDHLSNRMAAEYAASRRFQEGNPDLPTRDAVRMVKKLFRDAIKRGHSDTLTEGDNTLAILCWLFQGNAAHTAFAAVDGFFASKHVRFMFRHVRDLQRRCGNVPLVASSWSERDDVQKWFEVLGYKHDTNFGPSKIFVLWPE